MSLWKTCSQLGGRKESPSILEFPHSFHSGVHDVGICCKAGVWRHQQSSELRSSFANSHITTQWSLTTNTVLNELPPGWPATIKKMALPQFKDDSAMANQSSHAWVTSTGSRFRVLWKYMHSEVLWIIPNNSENLFCYTNESKPSLPHYLQSSWRKWISMYIVSV